MFGREVKIHLYDDVYINVFVSCLPDTPDSELQRIGLITLLDHIKIKLEQYK